MTCLSSVQRLTTLEAAVERFQSSKDLAMYDWLSFLRLRLRDVDAKFVL